jgi:hypothetical protein
VADGDRLVRFHAPAAPTLTAIPAFTKTTPLTISGTTAPLARVDLFANDETTPHQTTAASTGAFVLDVPLVENAENSFEVFATGAGGDGLTSPPAEATVTHDGFVPSVAFELPAAGAHVRQTVTVRAQASDNLGVASVALRAGTQPLTTTLTPPPPASAVTATASWNTIGLSDGAYDLIADVIDQAGNAATATRNVFVDNTPPVARIEGTPPAAISIPTLTIAFSATDNLAPVESLTFSWRLDNGPWTAFGLTTNATLVGLSEAAHRFEVKARDLAGNESAVVAHDFTVTIGPFITAITPSSGDIGSDVTITGMNFTPGPALVAFAGTAAVVRSLTATTIVTTVPPGARSGLVTVSNAKGVASRNFDVTSAQGFTITVAPGDGTVVQGMSLVYTVELPSGATPFTGLAFLSVGGLPDGVTAVFGAPALTGGGRTTLTLTAAVNAPTTPTPRAFVVSATATTDLGVVTRTTAPTIKILATGVTGASGQFTLVDGSPVEGIRLFLDDKTATTDAGGNFLFLGVSAGPQMMGVDANAAREGYPIYAIDVTVVANVVTALGPFRITPPPPAERFVPITNAVQDQVVSDPRFPDFSLTLPAGVTITGWDGTPKTRIAIERLDPAALPMPPPTFETRSFYQIFFGTPMGGLPTLNGQSAKLPVTLPND